MACASANIKLNALFNNRLTSIIEQTIRQKLPKGFQRSEFLLEHGAVDMIVHRTEMRDTIARILSKLSHTPLLAEEPVEPEEEEVAPQEDVEPAAPDGTTEGDE